MEKRIINVRQINRVLSPQPRVNINYDVALEYQEAMDNGSKFPPLSVVYNPETEEYYLVDGWHRLIAYSNRRELNIDVEVTIGSARDAVLLACSANDRHGLQRSVQDKRKAVLTLLRDKEWGKYSDRHIARLCSVSPKTVAKYRDEKAESDKELEEVLSKGEIIIDEVLTMEFHSQKQNDDEDDNEIFNCGIPQLKKDNEDDSDEFLTMQLHSQKQNPDEEEPDDKIRQRTYIHHESGKPTTMNTSNIGRKKTKLQINDIDHFRQDVINLLNSYRETSNSRIYTMIENIEELMI